MAGWVTQVGAWTTGKAGAHGRVPSVTLLATRYLTSSCKDMLCSLRKKEGVV